MIATNKDSFNDCFVSNGAKLKPKSGFRQLSLDAHDHISISSVECNTVMFLTKGAISVALDGKATVNITVPYMFLIPNGKRAEIIMLSNSILVEMSFKEYVAICKKSDLTDFSIFRPKQTPCLNSLPLVDQIFPLLIIRLCTCYIRNY